MGAYEHKGGTPASPDYEEHDVDYTVQNERAIADLAARLDAQLRILDSHNRSVGSCLKTYDMLDARLDALEFQADMLEQAVKDQARNSNASAIAFTDRLDALAERVVELWRLAGFRDRLISKHYDMLESLDARIAALERPNEPPNTWERVWTGIHTIRERNLALAERVADLEASRTEHGKLILALEDRAAADDAAITELSRRINDLAANQDRLLGRAGVEWVRGGGAPEYDVDVTEKEG